MTFLFQELLKYILSEVGVITFFVLWTLYQLYSPSWLPDTKVQSIIHGVEEDVLETKRLLVSTITVIRAVVRTNDEVDTKSVDEYLVENGVEPEDFIVNEDDPMKDNKPPNPGDD